MNQENQETMNQNQNQTERNEPIYRFRNKTGFKDGTDYIDIQGDSITLVSLDGSRVTYTKGGLDRLQPSRQLAAEGNWTEEVIHPEPEQPKPMTIREAAKKLQEMGISHVDDVNVRLVWRDSAWHLECSVYRDTKRYTGSSFELVFKQIEAIEKAKAGISLSEADRIINL